MAQAPKAVTLRKEDYREAPSWLGRLFQQLNDHLAAVSTALAGGLSRSENLRSVVKTLKFTTLATPADTFPVLAKHGLDQRPADVWVGRLSPAPATAWSMTWELDSSGQLSVRFQGLAASTEYEARLVIE